MTQSKLATVAPNSAAMRSEMVDLPAPVHPLTTTSHGCSSMRPSTGT